MQEFGIDLLQAVRWSVFKVNIDIPTGENALSIHSEKELVTISVKQILDEKIGLFCKCTTFQYSNDICGIVAFDETKDIIDFTGILTDICREVKRLLAVEIYIGVGRTTDILAHVRDCYNEAKSALAFKSMADIGNVIYINDVEPIKKNYVKLSEKCEKEFAEMIKSGQEDCLKENAATITGEIFGAKLHDSQRQLLIIDAFSAIYSLLKKYEIDPGAIFGEDVDFFEILAKINDETEFQNWLIDVGGKVFTNLNNDRRNTTQGFVQQAKRYILDNYTDPELSLEGVCAILHISPTYFSAVFKKETGQSYIGFLTEIRMQKAVELLNTTDEKTYVIAEKVGYAEPNYFGYVFKKQLGVSPAKFRTQ
ncbi:MAG: helix-turn-helix domain-containing protein, partial [Oscillospiraceae bacterium]